MRSENFPFEVGQPVRITKNLKGTKTDKKYTIAKDMYNMAGKTFLIHQIDGSRIRIKNPNKNSGGRDTYVFHPDDLFPLSCEINLPPAATFDPKNLNI